jgi:hypothetical protein
MMPKSFLFFVLITLLVSCKNASKDTAPPEVPPSEAALMIENTLQNANGMEGKINIMGYFVVPFYTGELKENGSFQITLPNHFDQVTGRAFEAYNSSPIADYELHYSTALESFPDADGLSFKEKGARLAFAGKYYRFEVTGTNTSSYIYPASSENFLRFVVGTKDAAPETGYHYYYIYAKEPFSIHGATTTDNLFEDGTEQIYKRTDSYNLDINKGWNLIRYEVNALSESSKGTEKISKSVVSNLGINTKPEPWFISSK